MAHAAVGLAMLVALAGASSCKGRKTSTRRSPPVDLIRLKATCFHMGSAAGEGKPEERPRRRVCLGAFGIEKTKVTNGRYARCVAAGKCRGAAYVHKKGYGHPEMPVVGVTWSDARTYCRYVGRRLPTEAEWEYAACGGERRIYPWGDQTPTCARVHFKGCLPKHLIPIGPRSPRSPTGAIGMVGNAWEWIADRWAGSKNRVIRGGSYYDPADCLRCRARFHWKPDARLTDVGFRCAVSLSNAADTRHPSRRAGSARLGGGSAAREQCPARGGGTGRSPEKDQQ